MSIVFLYPFIIFFLIEKKHQLHFLHRDYVISKFLRLVPDTYWPGKLEWNFDSEHILGGSVVVGTPVESRGYGMSIGTRREFWDNFGVVLETDCKEGRADW